MARQLWLSHSQHCHILGQLVTILIDFVKNNYLKHIVKIDHLCLVLMRLIVKRILETAHRKFNLSSHRPKQNKLRKSNKNVFKVTAIVYFQTHVLFYQFGVRGLAGDRAKHPASFI